MNGHITSNGVLDLDSHVLARFHVSKLLLLQIQISTTDNPHDIVQFGLDSWPGDAPSSILSNRE